MELEGYLRILRAHWLAIVMLTLVGIAGASGWLLLQPKMYTAESSGYVSSRSASDTGLALAGDSLARAKVKSYIDIGSWRSVAEHTIDELGLSTSPEALVSNVNVTNPADTVVVKVTATASTPEHARDIAEAWIRGMVVEIAALEGGTAADPAAVTLVSGDSARLPTSPSSPNTRLALALGALVGVALGVAFAVLRFTLDRRVRSPEKVERETGVAVVGAIPSVPSFTGENRLIPFESSPSSRGLSNETFAMAEAMRELRTNIQFMDVDKPPRVIVVSSPLPGDGKSTMSANLAITLAANGQRVVLIDGDLRRPTQASIFGLLEGVGLTDVLASRASLADVAQPADPSGRLMVLGAGILPPNPSEVLGSERMRTLLDALSRQAIVIVDAPPLLPVTDAAVLGARADGVIVVANTGRTTYEMLDKALLNIERASARTLGIVMNRVPRKGLGAAYYGYQYRGGYYQDGTRRKRGRGEPVPEAPVTADAAATEALRK